MKILILGAATNNGYKSIGLNKSISGGGWVENLIKCIRKMDDSLEIHSAFYSDGVDCVTTGEVDGVYYHALPAWIRDLRDCNHRMINDLKTLGELVNPDVLHIIGTERRFNYELAKIIGMNRTVVSITGMVSVCEKHYYGGIDITSFFMPSIGDIIRKGGPIKERKRFIEQGKYEIKLLQEAKYVMGRTTWDYACVTQINPSIEYTFCSEILNPLYLANSWDVNRKQKHRIFVSQGTYPLKGLHMLFDALPYLFKKYPNCSVYIAGADITKNDGLIGKIKQTTYSKFLLKKIKQLNISMNRIHFVGPLNVDGMIDQYLSCNVFVLPSAIENSPNSLGEAMSLGVPCVASCVGGVQDMMRDKVDGFIYPFDEPYMLAHYIEKIFESDSLCEKISICAREHARDRFNSDEVVKTTIELYKKIASKNH